MSPARIGSALLGLAFTPQTARRFALPGFILAACLAGLLAFGLFKLGWGIFDWFNDREAIQQDRREANAEFAGKQIDAERAAGAGKHARDTAESETQEGLENEVDDADRNGRSAADDLWNGGLFDTEDEKR